MPQKDQDPGVLELLRDIRSQQDLQGQKLDEITRRVTGGLNVTNGLEFKVAQMEAREESRKFWMQTFGVTAVASAFTAIGTLISHVMKGSTN